MLLPIYQSIFPMKTIVASLLGVAATTSLAILSMSGAVFAGDVANGDEFRQGAEDYQARATLARSEGQEEEAAMYDRLAEIKLDAASLADEGRWDEIDWTEYYELTEEL